MNSACIFRGLQEGAAKGKRNFPMPKDWNAAFELLMKSSDAGVRQQALGLAVVFGDKNALGTLRKVLADAKADTAARRGTYCTGGSQRRRKRKLLQAAAQ